MDNPTNETATGNKGIEVIPFFFVADVSYSMQGDRIDEVNKLLPTVKEALQEHPAVSDRIRFSLISFSDDATVELPLSDLLLIDNSALPVMNIRGGTNYTEALRSLKGEIQRAHSLITTDGFKFKRPVALFLSDGEPNESEAEWKAAFDELTAIEAFPNLMPVGIGNECDRNVIEALAHRKTGPVPVPALFTKDNANIGNVLKELIVALTKSVIASAAALDSGSSVPGGHAGAFVNTVTESEEVKDGMDFTWNDMD